MPFATLGSTMQLRLIVIGLLLRVRDGMCRRTVYLPTSFQALILTCRLLSCRHSGVLPTAKPHSRFCPHTSPMASDRVRTAKSQRSLEMSVYFHGENWRSGNFLCLNAGFKTLDQLKNKPRLQVRDALV